MTRLRSMDVTIAGVTRSYRFDPAVEVESDEEGPASLELLEQAETTEVVLEGGITSARVTVHYTYQVDGSVEVDLEDLEGEAGDFDDVRSIAESGTDDIFEAINSDVEENVSYEYITIDSVDVDECFDEDGNSIDE